MVLRKEVSNIRLMHSKRFLSPEIQKDVTIIVNIDKSNKTTKHQYIQTRKCGLDRVNPILSYTGEMLKYKRAYFTTLLELFPSIYGYVSVHEKENSFHAFINSSETRKHKHKILASLFLLAEGVAIPLTVNKSGNITDLALKKANLQEDHFKVNISASSKFIIRVINFFIEEQKKKKIQFKYT